MIPLPGPASATVAGLVTTGPQTFGGAKTFSGNVVVSGSITGTSGSITGMTALAVASGGTIVANGTFTTATLTGDQLALRKPNYAGGGWVRALMQYEEYTGTVLSQLGVRGSNNTYAHSFLGAAYDNFAICWDANRNIGINNTFTFGTSAVGVVGIANGTAPSTSPADMIQIFSTDISGGDATLGLRTEAAVASESVTSDRTLLVKINGTTYKLCLKV